MSAELILDTRELVGDVLLEMVVWRVPGPVMGSSHFFKYRFYAGLLNGTCLVRTMSEARGITGTFAAGRNRINLPPSEGLRMISCRMCSCL